MTRTPGSPGPSADPLAGLTPPGAPPELKARVLATSRAALLAAPAPPDRWSLLWASRPLRLAWAATVLLLVAGHIALVRPSHPREESAAVPLLRAASEADAELAAIGRLPRLDPDARSLGPRPGELSTPSLPAAPESTKEDRT
ncbi:MAG: hypothetical protein HY900_08900 [Deltaproteobacteria bacterium]|nr:hypothetical protein [Deltaproteobacteria bacterium]